MAINFPIVTTFDDKATKKADQAFSALGRKFAAVFSVAAVVKFGKESVKAFQEAEKEANLLRAQLESINLGFASPFVNQYIDNLALLTGISGGELTDAFNRLSQATEDVTTAQQLLNTSLDIAAGTGKDLRTVTAALQRAYLGETTALAKLRIGYTTADLKARDFDEVLGELQDKFQGSSAKAANTLAGKMARLTESVEQAKEAFGEGLVKGLQDSQVEIEQLQEDVIGLGDALGYAAGQATGFFAKAFQDIVKDFEESDGAFQRFVRSLVKSTAEVTRLEEERGRAGLRARNRILKAEQSITKTKKEQDKLADKEKANALAIAKAKSVFDIEKIQIEAALQGKITGEERIRLQLMKEISNENATAAEDLVKKLKQVQEENAKIVKQLTTFPKANDPFVDWTKSLNSVTAQLTAIGQKKIVVDFLANYMPVSTAPITSIIAPTASAQAIAALSNPAKQAEASAQVAAVEEAKADAAVAVAKAGEAIAKAAEATEAAAVAVSTAVTAEEKAAANTAVIAAVAATEAATILTESAAAAEAIAATAAVIEAETLAIASENVANILAAEAATVEATTALTDAAAVLTESFSALASLGMFDFNFAGLDFTSLFIPDYAPPTVINVTVEGNVTAAEDLAEVITDIQYEYQRSGKSPLFSSIAI